MTIHEVKQALRDGNVAWPGGYPLFFVTAQGDALSFDAVRERFRDVIEDTKSPHRHSQWELAGVHVNWEDGDLRCAHTGKRIESAYAEEDAV